MITHFYCSDRSCRVHWINLGHWTKYPIRVPRALTVEWSDSPMTADVTFTWVHCGPSASFPKPRSIVYFHMEKCIDNKCDGGCLYD